jgi:hypothetical protein
MGSRIQNGIGTGLGIALRSSATAGFLGARWLSHAVSARSPVVPTPRVNLALASKVALDEIFFASEVLLATLVSLRDRQRVTREISRALSLYEEEGWLDEPARYHRKPPKLKEVSRDVSRSLWGRYQHLQFESRYEPHRGEPGRRRWLGYTPNRTAHAWLFEHEGEPHPWLVCVPGYRMGHPAVDFAGFRARWLHRVLGLNVAIPVLPLHGPRRVGRRGGDGFLTGDFLDTVHAQTQAVWDVRRLIGWLRKQRAPAVGVYGVSLGGYTTALLAALEPKLDCVIAGIPATDFVGLMHSHVPRCLLRAASHIGFPLERVELLLRVISPLALDPRVPHERRYLYAGLADRLAAPEHAHALWEHWDRPRLAWYEGSHVSFLWEKPVEKLVREALGSCGLLPARASQR